MKKILFLLAALLLAAAGFAQNKVEGVVMNENSEPLAGVAVVVKIRRRVYRPMLWDVFRLMQKKVRPWFSLS